MRESLEVLQLLVMRKKPLEMVPNSLLGGQLKIIQLLEKKLRINRIL